MEIRINKLHLRNFKGVRDAEFNFEGRNARIEGANGTGKSTVFDAFTWLMFGKDHRDQTPATFEIKTIDPSTGLPFPRLEHWVEAVITVDGEEHTLRRCWLEEWVKPTGRIEEVFKGHKSLFIIDGVDVGTQKAYDTTVQSWMKEDAFRLLTNPLCFIEGTDWQTRRKALLDLVKDAPERAKVREKFADLLERINHRKLEDIRKQIRAEKAANKKDLEICLNNISGMREALPLPVGEEDIDAQLSELHAERDGQLYDLKDLIKGIDTAIADYNTANADRKARIDAIWAEITKIQLQMGESITKEQKAAQDENNRAKTAALQAWTEIAEAEARIKTTLSLVTREEAHLEDLMKQRGEAAAELGALGEQYKAEKAQAFEYTPETTCPYCGQEIPAATREEAEGKARQHYLDARKAVLDGIVKKAEDIKAGARRLDETIEKCRAMIAEHKGTIEAAKTEKAAKEAEYKRLKEVPLKDLDAIAEAIRIPADKKVQELRLKASKEGGSDDALRDLTSKRRGVEKEVERITAEYAAKEQALTARLAVNGERDRQLALIAKKEQDARNFADAIAREEQEEQLIAEFVEADIRSVEGALSSLFKVARWKMFDRTIDGGLIEMCEVTSPDGVPLRSMNDAMKTLCGLDVIRVFGNYFSSRAPIFIDNAEGILKEDFGTPAQVIRLVVKDTPITLINE